MSEVPIAWRGDTPEEKRYKKTRLVAALIDAPIKLTGDFTDDELAEVGGLIPPESVGTLRRILAGVNEEA